MFSKEFNQVFQYAQQCAKKCDAVGSGHLLMGLTAVPSSAQKLLAGSGIDSSYQASAGSNLQKAEEVDTILRKAEMLADETGSDFVTPLHLLYAILQFDGCYAYEAIKFKLGDVAGVKALENAVRQQLPPKKVTSNNAELAFAGSATNYVNGNQLLFTTDLTELAQSGRFDKVIGRDAETERVIQTLVRRTKNNPVLIGEAGVGKTAVVEGLAQRLASGCVPFELVGKRLLEVDVSAMLAGTRYRGDFEERFKSLLATVQSQGNVILFIDELHNLCGAGSTGENGMDAAEILKPALARGALQLVGATTLDEYHRYVEKDPALERRFQPITVNEPSPEIAVQIVDGVKEKYEQHHGVTITEEAVETAVYLSVRYLPDRHLPDKAFDVIDEACSRLKIKNTSANPELTVLQQNVVQMQSQLQKATAENNVTLTEKYSELYAKAVSDYNTFVAKQRKNITLTSDEVAKAVADMTGIPVAELSKGEKDRLLHLEEELGKRVIGQKQAIRAVSLAVRRQRAGLKDPNKPIGSFIFVGPTGVGKTELAKALSDCIFGEETEVVRVDMSEYMEKESTAKLIGAPPGYAGYDEGGFLTDKIHRHPYSVVLFDEVEKAHPDVFNLLLQILDEGRLTDSHGKTIDFKNTVIILTSNVGAGQSTQNVNDGKYVSYEQLVADVTENLKKFFRPEFLNRVDETVVFDYLSKQDTVQITELLCTNLGKRLKGTLKLRFSENAVNVIATEGYDKAYGARPLKRAIQRKIEDVLAEKLLAGEFSKGDAILIDAQNGKIVFVKQ